MKKILALLRVSTTQQDLASQQMDILKYLTKEGYQEEEIEWIEAKGASAVKASKSYLQMLSDVKDILTTKGIKTLVIWHLNRLGRKKKYIQDMINWFVDNQIQLICLNPFVKLLNEDYSYSQANDMLFQMFAIMIEVDTNELFEKTKRGREFKKSEGKYIGGRIRTGFRKNSEGYIVEDEEELKLVRTIFNEYSTGNFSVAKLTNDLKERGIRITERHLWSILNNPLYKESVGSEIWEKCKEIREGFRIATRETKHYNLGCGIIKCSCGSNYIATGGHYICYKKKFHKRFINDKCDPSKSPVIKIETLDNLLWEEAKKLHSQYLINGYYQESIKIKESIEVLKQKIDKKNQDILDLSEKLRRIDEGYEELRLTKEQWQSKRGRKIAESITNQKELLSLNDELEQMESRLYSVTHYQGVDLDSIGQEEKQRIVKGYIKEVRLGYCQYNQRKCISITFNGKLWIYDFNSVSKDKIIAMEMA